MDNNVGFMSSLMLFFIRVLSFFTPIADVGRNIAIGTYNKFTSGFERGIKFIKDEPEDSKSEDGSPVGTKGEEHVDKGTSTAEIEEAASTAAENKNSKECDAGNPPDVDGDQNPRSHDEDEERSDSSDSIRKSSESNEDEPIEQCPCSKCVEKYNQKKHSCSEDDSQDSDREQTGNTVIQNKSDEVVTKETQDTSDKPGSKVVQKLVREKRKKGDITAHVSEYDPTNNIEEPRETPCQVSNDKTAKVLAETPDNEECEPKENPRRKDLTKPMHEIESNRVSPKTRERNERSTVDNDDDEYNLIDDHKTIITYKQPINKRDISSNDNLSPSNSGPDDKHENRAEVSGGEGRKEKS